MALVSPGVKVTVTDQSTYVGNGPGSVPYVLLVTAQNKKSGVSTSVAPGTLEVNAGKLYLITSQYELLATYGSPTFYDNGNELNEYGLLAAYSSLALTNRMYVQRADIDLSTLVGSSSRPQGPVTNNSWVLNTTKSSWGITTWNSLTQQFEPGNGILVTDPSQIDAGTGGPVQSLGNPGDFGQTFGDYAITLVNSGSGVNTDNLLWQKVNPVLLPSGTQSPLATAIRNTWQQVGSAQWQQWAGPCIVGQWITVNPAPAWPSTYNLSFNGVSINGITYNGVWADAIATIQSKINQLGDPDQYITWQYKQGTNNTVARVLIYANPTATAVNTGNVGAVQYVHFSTNQSDAATQAFFGFAPGNYAGNNFIQAPNYQAPSWQAAYVIPTTPVTLQGGAAYGTYQITNSVKAYSTVGCFTELEKYDATLNTYSPQIAYWYPNDASANYGLDPVSGGTNIPIGKTYVQYDLAQDWEEYPASSYYTTPQMGASNILYRYATGPTVVTGTVQNPAGITTGDSFYILVSQPGVDTWLGKESVGVYAGTAYALKIILAEDGIDGVVLGINSTGFPNITATNVNGFLEISHATGGSIYIIDDTTNIFGKLGFNTNVPGVRTSPIPRSNSLIFSNWATAPQWEYGLKDISGVQNPADGTIWYYNVPTVADILIQNGGSWMGYQNCLNSARGENLSLTDPNGPIFSPTVPMQQSNGNALVAGDLWINTTDLDIYPVIYRYTAVIGGGFVWTLLDNTDHVSSNGILFADARWAPNGTTNPVSDPLPTIPSLLVSNYVDLDVPNPLLYPQGTLLWNTRRSGYNVKKFALNYFNNVTFPNVTLPAQTNTWVSVSGNKADGSPYMGRQAQRSIIVKALKSTIDTNLAIREEQNAFTLMACPQYPELASNMVALNNERNNTSLVLVDTPLRLPPQNIVSWATNNNGLGLPALDGLTVGDPYAAAFYPSGLTTDLSGNAAVVPPSHMVLRTILNSDHESYPWIPAAGYRRGLVSNAYQIGYLDETTNNFVPLQINQGTRDVVYTNSVNPLTFIPGHGIVVFGNKTVTGLTSALDRINVARLVAYLRGRLQEVADQYLFEPNDEITRNSILNAINGLMVDLVNKRALYDYLVICDASNNTPYRIDNNQLWVDVAIEPVKAVEFIYIPIRIVNTGAIVNG